MERIDRSYNTDNRDLSELEEKVLILDTIYLLGNLCSDQRKLAEAEKIYQRTLQGYKKALSAEHTSTLRTVNSLDTLYKD